MECPSAEAAVSGLADCSGISSLHDHGGAASLPVEHGGCLRIQRLFRQTHLVEEISKFCVDMALSAEYSFLALGCDGAFANEKLIAHIMNITEELEGRKIC